MLVANIIRIVIVLTFVDVICAKLTCLERLTIQYGSDVVKIGKRPHYVELASCIKCSLYRLRTVLSLDDDFRNHGVELCRDAAGEGGSSRSRSIQPAIPSSSSAK